MFGRKTTAGDSSGDDANFNLNAAASAAAEFDPSSAPVLAVPAVEAAPAAASTTTGRITRGLFGFVRNIVFRTTASESPAAARAMMNGESSSSDSGGGDNNHVNAAGSSSDDTASSFASMSLRSIVSITSIVAGGGGDTTKKRVSFSGQVLIRVIPNLDDIGTAACANCWWQRNDYDTFEHNNTRIEEMMKRNYYGTISLTAGQRSRRSRSRQRQRMLQPRRSNSADSQDSNDSSVGDIDAGDNDNEEYEDRFEYCTRGLECRTIVAERQRSKSRDDARRALFGGPFGSGAMFDNHDVIADNYARACYANVQGAYMRGLYDEEVMKELLHNDAEFLVYYHNVMTTSPDNDEINPRPVLSTTIVVPPPPPPPSSTTPNSSAVSPAQLQVYRKEREQYMKSRSKRRYRTTTAASNATTEATAKSAERAPSTD